MAVEQFTAALRQRLKKKKKIKLLLLIKYFKTYATTNDEILISCGCAAMFISIMEASLQI